MRFDNVISVCAIKDQHVWARTAPSVLENIDSYRYTLIVPEHELKVFQKITPSEYEVISENQFKTGFFAYLANSATDSKSSIGWYIQQLLKLSALASIPKDQVALIWDADTVPLKKLTFESNGKLACYKGNEHHEPYFSTIERLLGLKKANKISYIAQCMPFRSSWARELFELIEEKNDCRWQEAVIKAIDFSRPSGFSEYELLGTFVEYNYPGELAILTNPWQRYGNGLIGSVEHLDYFQKILGLRYDFISFEKWDKSYSLYSQYLKKLGLALVYK